MPRRQGAGQEDEAMNANAFLLSAALLLSLPASAQGGLITGTVTDMATLEPIAGLTVKATSPNMQGEKTAVTDASGAYQVPQLPPGSYVLRFEAPGYPGWMRAGISIRLGSTRRVDVAVPPADMEGCFFGLGPVPEIDVDSTRTGVNVGEAFVRNIPLPSR
jgi:hypothetical protein